MCYKIVFLFFYRLSQQKFKNLERSPHGVAHLLMCFYIIHSLNIQQFERSGKSETRGQVFSLRANSHVQDILARFLRLACTHPHLHMVTPSVSCVNVGVCPNPKKQICPETSGQTVGFDFSWDALGTKDINSLVYPPLVTSIRLIPTSVT